MSTWYFEDIKVGSTHSFGDAEITAGDIVAFAEKYAPYLPLRDENPPHVRGPAAPQALVYAIWSRLLFEETKDWPVRARLGQDALRWYRTAHAGDCLSVQLTFVTTDDCARDHGLVITQHDVTNQDGNLILSLMTRSLLNKSE